MAHYWHAVLAWIELHPVFFVCVAWPAITAIVTSAFKVFRKTDAELAEMEKTQPKRAHLIRLVKASGLDAPVTLAFLWRVLTRGKPMPKDSAPKEDEEV